MCTPTQHRVCGSQLAVCLVSLFCVCVSLVRVVIICLASTHTASVSSPSLTVLHLPTYIHIMCCPSCLFGLTMGSRGKTDATVHAQKVVRRMARAACARAWPAGWRRRWRLLARRAGFQRRCTLRAPVGTAAAPLRHTFVAPPLSSRFFKRLSSSQG